MFVIKSPQGYFSFKKVAFTQDIKEAAKYESRERANKIIRLSYDLLKPLLPETREEYIAKYTVEKLPETKNSFRNLDKEAFDEGIDHAANGGDLLDNTYSNGDANLWHSWNYGYFTKLSRMASAKIVELEEMVNANTSPAF